MSDLIESEAEEDLDESLSSESGGGEEDEDEEEEEGEDDNVEDLINDDPEEEESEKSDEEVETKRKRREEENFELEEEDYDLIEENIGVRLQDRKKFKRVKLKSLDSDEEEDEQPEKAEKQAISSKLFEGDEAGNEPVAQETPANVAQEDIDLDESESEDDVDDFIVDDEGRPITHKKKKKHRFVGDGVHDSALQEAQDIFGLDFDMEEFEKYGQGGFDEEEEEYESEEDERDAGARRQRVKKKQTKSIFEVFEPSELEKGMLTDRDNEIRLTDIPERFQTREIPVKPTEDGELEEEAEWMYKHVFLDLPISIQQDITDPSLPTTVHTTKPPSTVAKIKEALNLMRNQFFEVPFIASYRKEYIEPELTMDDLWKIWQWDEKWMQLRTRKHNLHRLFEEMQEFQFNKIQENKDEPLDDDERILQEGDIDRLESVQTMEELKDVYQHFMLYYGYKVQDMREARRKKILAERQQRQQRQLEGEEPEEQEKEEPLPSKLKMPARRDLYTICKQAGLEGMAKKFGLTPDQFGENLRDNYQRHETEQQPDEPEETAESYLTSKFETTEQVLEGARHMVAMQIARDPLVRQCVRQTFYERAKVNIKPTKKGKKEIDEFHAYSAFKYVEKKPVKDLKGEQFLKMIMAEEEGLLVISLGIDMDRNSGYSTYFDEVKQLYYRDEFSHLVQEWNKERSKALARAFEKMLYPLFEKELKTKLLMEAKQFIIKSCAKRLRSSIEIAPYQPEQQHDDQDYDDGHSTVDGLRVMACSFVSEVGSPAFVAMLDGGGQVIDFLKLPGLLARKNSLKAREREQKEKDLEVLKKFIMKRRPHVVAVAGQGRDAMQVADDIKFSINELEQEHQMATISVELVDGEVARVFQGSTRAENEFREYPAILRHAVSIGRRLQDPLAEFSALCVEEDELLCLKLHPLQDQVPKDQLLRALHTEFVTVTNEVGVDPNRLLDHPHVSSLMQFVCGLGPRKGTMLLKSLRQQCQRLENRSQLVTVCNMGPKVFLNCAGFIKIDTAALNETTGNYLEVLDGSRVHPETYEWARKMAVDALEYDEVTEESNPSAALEEILESPERLKDLDLDAFAEELERQGYGNKRITLYDIRDELFGRYRERRPPYRALSIEDRFRLLTGETSETLYVGKLIMCTVTGFAHRKPPRDMIDQANPVRDDDSGLWQCPFCLKNDYSDLSEVWTHLDNGSCPGQTIGVRTRMDNGITGFIQTRNISDKQVKSPQDRVRVGMTLHCRVLRVNMEKFQVDLTCKTSDLTDKDGKYRIQKDLYFNDKAYSREKKEQEVAKKKANRPKYVKRVIVHPAFHNISFKEAEKLLATMEQGECIVRPSSKGADHLTVTWKVDNEVYQHVDVREEGKENTFSLGRSLWIESEEFEDLDEIIARHIQPMASLAREILNHKYFRAADGGQKSKMEEILLTEKKRTPQRIPYFLSTSKEFPGKFLLGYLPRVKPRVEFVTVTPDGFRYRGRVHATLNGLFRWFKEHFRDPIPGVSPRLRTPVAMSEGNTPYTPGATPDIRLDMDPSQLLPQLQQHFPRGITADSKVYSALAAVARQSQSQQKQSTPTYSSQWNSAATGGTPTQAAGSQNSTAFPQYPQYGYYQQHQDQTSSLVASASQYAAERQRKLRQQQQEQEQAYSR